MTMRLIRISFFFLVLLIVPTVAGGQTPGSPASGASSEDVAKQFGMLRIGAVARRH